MILFGKLFIFLLLFSFHYFSILNATYLDEYEYSFTYSTNSSKERIKQLEENASEELFDNRGSGQYWIDKLWGWYWQVPKVKSEAKNAIKRLELLQIRTKRLKRDGERDKDRERERERGFFPHSLSSLAQFSLPSSQMEQPMIYVMQSPSPFPMSVPPFPSLASSPPQPKIPSLAITPQPVTFLPPSPPPSPKTVYRPPPSPPPPPLPPCKTPPIPPSNQPIPITPAKVNKVAKESFKLGQEISKMESEINQPIPAQAIAPIASAAVTPAYISQIEQLYQKAIELRKFLKTLQPLPISGLIPEKEGGGHLIPGMIPIPTIPAKEYDNDMETVFDNNSPKSDYFSSQFPSSSFNSPPYRSKMDRFEDYERGYRDRQMEEPDKRDLRKQKKSHHHQGHGKSHKNHRYGHNPNDCSIYLKGKNQGNPDNFNNYANNANYSNRNYDDGNGGNYRYSFPSSSDSMESSFSSFDSSPKDDSMDSMDSSSSIPQYRFAYPEGDEQEESQTQTGTESRTGIEGNKINKDNQKQGNRARENLPKKEGISNQPSIKQKPQLQQFQKPQSQSKSQSQSQQQQKQQVSPDLIQLRANFRELEGDSRSLPPPFPMSSDDPFQRSKKNIGHLLAEQRWIVLHREMSMRLSKWIRDLERYLGHLYHLRRRAIMMERMSLSANEEYRYQRLKALNKKIAKRKARLMEMDKATI